MNNTLGSQPALSGRCIHLGLKDDPQTCLAYPSNWNHCHHARPPESIQLEHQRQYCHTLHHDQCPVFQNEEMGPLPPEVRGRHDPTKGRTRRFARIIILLLILALALLIVLLAQSPSLLSEIRSGLFGKTMVSATSLETTSAPSILMATPLAENSTMVPFSMPGIISTRTVVFAPPDYSSNSAASPTFTAWPSNLCGHSLDEPFGSNPVFIIHKARGGESLNMYAGNYHTSVAAILAVNYQLPSPLWNDWILVIPVGETQMEATPSFEPRQADSTVNSIESLARVYSTDALELAQYNAFDESCHAFYGWLLIPHQKPAP